MIPADPGYFWTPARYLNLIITCYYLFDAGSTPNVGEGCLDDLLYEVHSIPPQCTPSSTWKGYPKGLVHPA